MSSTTSSSDIGILSADQIALASRRPQARDRKARIGVIGAGWWATTNHLPLLRARQDVAMVSVCGTDPEVNRRILVDFGFEHATTDYRELLRQRLDGVIVASPHSLHAEHARAALLAGFHVMVEKPMATSASDARELVRLADESGKHLLVPYGWHYRPLTARARQYMQSGAVGDIEFVLCHMASPAKNLFTGVSFDHAAGSYVAPNLATYADPTISGGGYGQGQLSHALGLLAFLTGLRAESVFARMTSPNSRTDLYDSLSVRFVGGAIASIGGAATVPDGGPFQLDIRVFGSKGMLLYDVERERVELHTHSGRHEQSPVTPGDGAYRCDEPPHEFVELILGLSRDNHSPGTVALEAVNILDAAYRSSASGRNELVGSGVP